MAARRSAICLGWLIAAGIIALSGCGGPERPTCYPVAGQVLLDGKPLAEARVIFEPLFAAAQAQPRPMAVSDGEGRFRLTTFGDYDGAMPGEWAATIELRAPRQVGDEIVRDGPNQLPARYANAETSGLRFTVQPPENSLPAIRLEKR